MEQAQTTLSVSFSVTTLAYHVPALELPGKRHQIQVDFENGEHVFTSSDFDLGAIHILGGHNLIERLSFRYSNDSALGVITI